MKNTQIYFIQSEAVLMEYEKLVCKFCKECIGMNLKQEIIKTDSKVNGDTIAVRCDNYYPKDEYIEPLSLD